VQVFRRSASKPVGARIVGRQPRDDRNARAPSRAQVLDAGMPVLSLGEQEV